MEPSVGQALTGAAPAPGLLILTGASHTGKTTVAQAILDIAGPPAASLSVDGALGDTIVHPLRSIWQEIPLAYELLARQLDILLSRGWFVVLESTFTYVPENGPPEFHLDALQGMIEIAERQNAPWLLAQLIADGKVTGSRADATGRLSPEIVEATGKAHDKAEMPASTVRVEIGDATPEQLALELLAALQERSTLA